MKFLKPTALKHKCWKTERSLKSRAALLAKEKQETIILYNICFLSYLFSFVPGTFFLICFDLFICHLQIFFCQTYFLADYKPPACFLYAHAQYLLLNNCIVLKDYSWSFYYFQTLYCVFVFTSFWPEDTHAWLVLFSQLNFSKVIKNIQVTILFRRT